VLLAIQIPFDDSPEYLVVRVTGSLAGMERWVWEGLGAVRGWGDAIGVCACTEEWVSDIEDKKWLGKVELCGVDCTRPELLVNGWVAKGSKDLRRGFCDMTPAFEWESKRCGVIAFEFLYGTTTMAPICHMMVKPHGARCP